MRISLKRGSRGADFFHPLDPAPRTAILQSGFRQTQAIRVFEHGWTGKTAEFRPEAIAAALDVLRGLGRNGIEVDRAVIVLTFGWVSRIGDEDRDELWDAFGVPVFEQILGPRNQLLAVECEAHSGLHVHGSPPESPLEFGVCGCGSDLPRFVEPLRPVPAAVA